MLMHCVRRTRVSAQEALSVFTLIAWTAVFFSGCYAGTARIRVEGHVVDENGDAVSGAEVALKPGPDSRLRDSGFRIVTDKSGGFGLSYGYSPWTASRDRSFILSVKKEGFAFHEKTLSEKPSFLRVVVVLSKESPET